MKPNKPDFYKDITAKELFLAAQCHYQEAASPEFVRGLQGGFEAAVDGMAGAFVTGIIFALGEHAALTAGAALGISLAGPDGWMYVAKYWIKKYRKEKETPAHAGV